MGLQFHPPDNLSGPLRRCAALAAVVLGFAGCAGILPFGGDGPREQWLTSSPRGALHVEVRLADRGTEPGFQPGKRLYYRAFDARGAGQVEVVRFSPLGISRADQGFVEELSFLSQRSRPVREEYKLPRGKRSHYLNEGNETILSFANAKQAKVDVIVRVFDDGFAFRYRFPETAKGPFSVVSEESGFAIPEGARAFMAPYDRRDDRRPNYESLFLSVTAGAPSPRESGWIFPALFSLPSGHHVLLTESGLDAGYAATHLARDAPRGVYRIAFPHPEELGGRYEATPSWSLPWTTPWRVVMVGDRLGSIVESSLVTDLAAPSVLADTSWIKPGRASWSWWSDGASPKTFSRVVPFIDLAADMGWEYSLVDAGWGQMQGGTWQDLVAHAQRRRVGIYFSYRSGLPVPQLPPRAPAESLDARSRSALLAQLAAAGVSGIKVTPFDSDKQEAVKQYLGILADAAAHKLIVNFHGSTLPRGWDRTYPNLLSMEGVRGAEGYSGDAAYAYTAPAHNTILAFTRNVVGPMDYTPVTFSNKKVAHRTTHAHELALSVIFESGVQHFADAVESYRALPGEVQSFLRFVPADWDETRLLDGEPGKLVVMARRKGRAWYVAGINGENQAKEIVPDLRRLAGGTGAEGARQHRSLIADGEGPAMFSISSGLQSLTDPPRIRMRPYGGFAMRLLPSD